MDETSEAHRRDTLPDLEKARHDLALRECRTLGHGTFTVQTGGLGTNGAPHLVMCDRCKQTWRVAR